MAFLCSLVPLGATTALPDSPGRVEQCTILFSETVPISNPGVVTFPRLPLSQAVKSCILWGENLPHIIVSFFKIYGLQINYML